jgi:hypothetical protein
MNPRQLFSRAIPRRALVLVAVLGASLAWAAPQAVDAAAPAAVARGEDCFDQIPQPDPALLEGLPVASDNERVDLQAPAFSNPTAVDNPLFPISDLHSVVLLGTVGGEDFRVEVTLLADPRIIEWNCQEVPTLVSQYVAFLDGQLYEVALDFYAQADDGSVWYFGEDVFNYEDGEVADTEGTWLAGREGPAAMIMPGDPQVGDVFRPENAPPLVFEEVTIQATGQTVDGPLGPVQGAIFTQELHLDGGFETKTFAPGYGEFATGDKEDVEVLALAVPTDALPIAAPQELDALLTDAVAAFEAAMADDFEAAGAALSAMNAAWLGYSVGAAALPPSLAEQMDAALAALGEAITAEDSDLAADSALQAARATLDFLLRYEATLEVDIARLGVGARQALLDAASQDGSAVLGDVATLKWTRDRLTRALAAPELQAIDAALEDLGAAAEEDDFDAASSAAAALLKVLAGLQHDGLPLFEGWNQLQAFPRGVAGVDRTIAYLNAAVDPGVSWETVAHFEDGAWRQAFRAAPLPAFNTLSEVEPGGDYWLFVSREAALSFLQSR